MKKYKSNHCKNTSAVILAGGRGRRVGGKDKGLLLWRKEPLIQHTYKRIEPQVNQVIVSCNRNFDQYRNLVEVFVPDDRDGYCGPLAGIEAACNLILTDYAVVIPCDAPSLPLDLVERLIYPLERQNNIEVTYAWDGLRSQFLFTAIRSEAFSSITTCLDAGGRSLKDWHSYVKTCEVDFSDKIDAFENINYESQLR